VKTSDQRHRPQPLLSRPASPLIAGRPHLCPGICGPPGPGKESSRFRHFEALRTVTATMSVCVSSGAGPVPEPEDRVHLLGVTLRSKRLVLIGRPDRRGQQGLDLGGADPAGRPQGRDRAPRAAAPRFGLSLAPFLRP
jgi:hypothetical protein